MIQAFSGPRCHWLGEPPAAKLCTHRSSVDLPLGEPGSGMSPDLRGCSGGWRDWGAERLKGVSPALDEGSGLFQVVFL